MRAICKYGYGYGALLLFLVIACKPAPPPPPPVPTDARANVDAGNASVVIDATSLTAVDAAAEPEALGGAYPAQMDLFDDNATVADGGTPTTTKTKLGVVGVPLGARAPRPLMIALHGGSDHPEWACNAWRGITGSYPFLVCPRGVGMESSLAWSTPADTKARIARAVALTRKTFGSWVRDDPSIVLVGFSMGATQTAYLAQSEPTRYRRVVFAESAYAPEPVMAFAAPWAKGGGERSIFLCTTPGCEGSYRRAARNVAAQHVPARLNIAGTTDHGMWEQVVQSMRRDWPWIVEGLDGWKEYAPPPSEEGALPGKTESFNP